MAKKQVKKKTKKESGVKKDVNVPPLIASSESPLIGPVIVWLVEFGGGEEAADQIAKRFNITPAEAEKLITSAWEKIRRAGICDVQTELGLAKKQNEAIYRSAFEEGNLYAAQAARNELSKLLKLYEAASLLAVDEAFQSETERLTRAHLENLELTQTGLPLEELARRIALFVVNNITEDKLETTREPAVPTKEGRQRKKES